MGNWWGSGEERTVLPVVVPLVASAVVPVSFLDAAVPELIVLRAVVTFVAVTVLPGYAVLSLLGVTPRSPTRTLLYAVGVSLPNVLVCVMVAHSLFPVGGMYSPRSTFSLGLVVAGATLIPSALARITNASVSLPGERLTIPTVRNPLPAALLGLLPVLSIVGTYVANRYDVTVVILAVLLLISTIPVMIANGSIPRHLYPLAVVAVSLAVLFHVNLITHHLWGWDIHYEYHVARVIREQGWRIGLDESLNSLPTATLLATVYSVVSGVSIVWVYKAFYPVIVSALPLGIFVFVRELQTHSRTAMWAVLSALVPVFYYGFFKDMPDKQSLAELYVILLLLVMFDRTVSTRCRQLLVVVFSLGLVFSHYAVSFFFLVFVVFTLFSLGVLTRIKWGLRLRGSRAVTPFVAVVVAAVWVGWYGMVTDGIILERAANQIVRTFLDFTNLFGQRSGADYATTSIRSVSWGLYALLLVMLVGFTVTGVAGITYSLWSLELDAQSFEFIAFSVAVIGLLVSSVAFTFGMGFDRTLRLALVILAPFALLGIQTLDAIISWLRGSLDERMGFERSFRLFALFLALFFCFSSGAAFAVTGEEVPPYSIGLDEDAGWPVYGDSEVRATRWLDQRTRDGESVAVFNRWETVKSRDGLLVAEVMGTDNIVSIAPSQTAVPEVRYVYVSDRPITKSETPYDYVRPDRTRFFSSVLRHADQVYTTENASIYLLEKPDHRLVARPTSRYRPSHRPQSTRPTDVSIVQRFNATNSLSEFRTHPDETPTLHAGDAISRAVVPVSPDRTPRIRPVTA